MKLFSRLILTGSALLMISGLVAQSISNAVIDSIFKKQGEIYFSFPLKNKQSVRQLTRIISIDKISKKTVYAYASKREFSELKRLVSDITVLPSPGTSTPESDLNMGGASQPEGERTQWNFYPTYDQYLDFMVGFVNNYPSLCKLDTVGTSIQGRMILALKISDNPSLEEAEPQVLYTSSIHGDETTGYVLMLHLIDHLLLSYGTDPELTELVNTTEIFINPLANPDGTYWGGNNSVYGARRYNANSIDLNRNFPDPKVGPHPDGNAWQQETEAWMEYATRNHFSVSANFHGGAEVFNYPWDTWSKLPADAEWWEFVGRMYVDSVHLVSPAGYFTLMNNGVTNGYAWYEVNGGRQDYMNYWHNCREVTLEISDIKLLPASQLINHWNYNYRSLINYIKQAHFGFNGVVTDTITDQPVAAKVLIQGHDFDNSEVYSHLPGGFYARPISEGTYNVTFSAPGYFPKTIQNVTVTNWETTRLDVQLRPLTFDAQDKAEAGVLVFPNPNNGRFRLKLPDAPVHTLCSVQVLNTIGGIVTTVALDAQDKTAPILIDLSNLPEGLYFLRFNSGYKIYIDKLIIRR